MSPTEDDDDCDGEAVDLDQPIELAIEDQLDLHAFAPKDVRPLVEDYLTLAAEKGFGEVRIIHGKGVGTLRRIVHAVLARHPRVAGYRLASDAGGWGATVVTLRSATGPS